MKRAVPLLLVAAAVLTAGLLLFFRMRMEPPTVPPYELKGVEGEATPEAGTEVVLRPGALFSLAAEPRNVVQGAVGARGFLLRGDDVEAWDPPYELGRDGSVLVHGRVEQLFRGVPPGPWEIALVIGRPETLPTARDLLRARDAGGGWAAWQIVRERVRLEG